MLDALTARGYQEVISYAFVDPQLQGRMFPQQQAIALTNPIAADLAAMRVSLWPGLLKAALDNLRRQQSRVRLFERGAVFLRSGNAILEAPRVAGVVVGARAPEQWGLGKEPADFFDLKSDVMRSSRAGRSHGRLSALNPPASRACTRGAAPQCGGMGQWLAGSASCTHPWAPIWAFPAAACCSNWT